MSILKIHLKVKGELYEPIAGFGLSKGNRRKPETDMGNGNEELSGHCCRKGPELQRIF